MVLTDCITGVIRFFFILMAYIWFDLGWGWAFTILIGILFLMTLARTTLKLSMFSSIFLVLIVGLLFFIGTAIYLNVPFCAFVDESSQLFLG
ncbi:MAG: hypothetical protein Q8Q35_04065 [Nanoarchaeota archaeon]|nr:hypothetical protein [Nanoarchaeota archaeon]